MKTTHGSIVPSFPIMLSARGCKGSKRRRARPGFASTRPACDRTRPARGRFLVAAVGSSELAELEMVEPHHGASRSQRFFFNVDLHATPPVSLIPAVHASSPTATPLHYTCILRHIISRRPGILMAPRAFTVFVDEPSSPPAAVDLPAAHEIAIAVAPPPSGPLLVYNPDKENINPATGQRASSEPLAKKRKTNVLATKLHVPPLAKKQKESKEGRKRARSDTVLKVVETSKPQEKKVKRSSSFKRTNSSAPSRARRSPSLPRLPEVAEEVETDKAPLALSQAQVDARCYELTVMPLADLSKAYEQAPSPTDHTAPTQFEKSSQEVCTCSIRALLSLTMPCHCSLRNNWSLQRSSSVWRPLCRHPPRTIRGPLLLPRLSEPTPSLPRRSANVSTRRSPSARRRPLANAMPCCEDRAWTAFPILTTISDRRCHTISDADTS